MRYAYPCTIGEDEEEKATTGRLAYNVTFPDVVGAHTGGWSWEEAWRWLRTAWAPPWARM